MCVCRAGGCAGQARGSQGDADHSQGSAAGDGGGEGPTPLAPPLQGHDVASSSKGSLFLFIFKFVKDCLLSYRTFVYFSLFEDADD